ncbi:hypothetical protein ACUNDV_23685 [Serratia sp. IR-2025]
MNIKRHMMRNVWAYMLAGLFLFWFLSIGLTVLVVMMAEAINGWAKVRPHNGRSAMAVRQQDQQRRRRKPLQHDDATGLEAASCVVHRR